VSASTTEPCPGTIGTSLLRVTVTMDDDQTLGGDGVGRSQMARQ
jgi:hypothetical protein